jgi:ribosomal protein S18 acetylase RimI-like enzyme
MTGIRVTRAGPEAVARRMDELCRLYDSVFAEPPFRWTPQESGRHRRMLSRLRDDPTFSTALLLDSGDRILGFAYGLTLEPDTDWWNGFTTPLPTDLRRETGGRTFALIDLAVDAAWRGRGFGRALVETLLVNRPEERATLCVQPSAAATHDFYRHLGWTHVGRKEGPPGAVSPQWDVFLVSLRAGPGSPGSP